MLRIKLASFHLQLCLFVCSIIYFQYKFTVQVPPIGKCRPGHSAPSPLPFATPLPYIHYKFKSSQASKARLQSSKHTGTKQNLTQNDHSGSFKVTCFGVSATQWKGNKVLSNTSDINNNMQINTSKTKEMFSGSSYRGQLPSSLYFNWFNRTCHYI